MGSSVPWAQVWALSLSSCDPQLASPVHLLFYSLTLRNVSLVHEEGAVSDLSPWWSCARESRTPPHSCLSPRCGRYCSGKVVPAGQPCCWWQLQVVHSCSCTFWYLRMQEQSGNQSPWVESKHAHQDTLAIFVTLSSDTAMGGSHCRYGIFARLQGRNGLRACGLPYLPRGCILWRLPCHSCSGCPYGGGGKRPPVLGFQAPKCPWCRERKSLPGTSSWLPLRAEVLCLACAHVPSCNVLAGEGVLGTHCTNPWSQSCPLQGVPTDNQQPLSSQEPGFSPHDFPGSISLGGK